MGLSHSWIAVQGAGREAVLEALGMTPGADVEGLPKKSGLAELPGGWVLVLISDPEKAFSPSYSALPTLGPAVACVEEEHVMYSEARGYRDGQEVWRVVRDCDVEPYEHVEVTGSPPPEFQRIRDELFAEHVAEGDADYIFDIPPRLAKAVSGFRVLDDWPDGVVFAELRPAASGAPSQGGFFARLFGRR